MRPKTRITRRNALKLGAAATALPLVHIRTAGAAGKLSLALWDHWVPAGDDAMQQGRRRLGREEQGRGRTRFPHRDRLQDQHHHGGRGTGQHRPRRLCIRYVDGARVRRQAGSGRRRDEAAHRANTASSGAPRVSRGRQRAWLAVPVGWGSAPLPPVRAHQPVQEFADIDVQKWFPAHESTPDASEGLDLRQPIEDGRGLPKAGYPFGLGCGSGSTDANQTWGATFGAFGADLLDAKGNITVESDNVMAVMEYCQRLVPFMPADTVQLRRCLQQPRVDFRQSGVDLEPAFRLGRGQARCAAGCGGLLDTSPIRAGRRAAWCRIGRISGASGISRRTRPRREGADRVSVAARAGGNPDRRGGRLRHPGVPVDVTTSRCGATSSRRRGRSTITLFGPGTMPNTTSPAPRARPRSPCRCGTASLMPGMVVRLVSGQTDQAGDRLGQGRTGRLLRESILR